MLVILALESKYLLFVMSIFGIKQSSTTVIQNNFCDLDMITCQQINKKKTKQTVRGNKYTSQCFIDIHVIGVINSLVLTSPTVVRLTTQTGPPKRTQTNQNLRWLKTVASTFQDLDFDVSL